MPADQLRGIICLKSSQHIGCDLRAEQVEANRAQGAEITPDNPPIWHCSDSRNTDRVGEGLQADMILPALPTQISRSYSDNPKDLPTLPYDQSARGLPGDRQILQPPEGQRAACPSLAMPATKRATTTTSSATPSKRPTDAGLSYYNEAILITLALAPCRSRAGRTSASTRKLGKTHQNVQVPEGRCPQGRGCLRRMRLAEIEEQPAEHGPAAESTEWRKADR